MRDAWLHASQHAITHADSHHVCMLSCEEVSGLRAKNSRETMRKRVRSLIKSKSPHAKLAATPPAFGVLFSNWRVGARFLIGFLQVFARRPLIISYDKEETRRRPPVVLPAHVKISKDDRLALVVRAFSSGMRRCAHTHGRSAV